MAAIDAQDSRAAGAAGADVRKHSLQLRVLGPLEALSDGVALTLGGRKERTALALLAAHVGTVVATDDLIDGIWGDEPTTAARSTPTSRTCAAGSATSSSMTVAATASRSNRTI